MLVFHKDQIMLRGPAGDLTVPAEDDVTPKLAMLYEGQCEGLGPAQAAKKYGYTRQRFHQLLRAFLTLGAAALQRKKTGPKTNYRRTDNVVRQIIRYLFLDRQASPQVVSQKLRQLHYPISIRSVQRVIADYGLQKKLYAAQSQSPVPPVATQHTKQRIKREPADPQSLERHVRQRLADKVSGSLVGLWLLIPEHLRLGTWDLLRGWTGHNTEEVQPRLALQMVHEAALCSTNLRQQRCLGQKGFELANGLPFLASDSSIHDLCEAHTIADAQDLQRALGKLRRASGHFRGQLLVLDPHRLPSYSQRQMTRHKDHDQHPAYKLSQTFFCLDADTAQPVCFTTGSSSRSVAQVTPELLHLTADILNPPPQRPLVLADAEHWATELFQFLRTQARFDLLVPMPQQRTYQRALQAFPASAFTSPWVGWATTKQPFHFHHLPELPLMQFVQRSGETPATYAFKAFLCTADRNEIQTLSVDYPKRWHIEEFFHTSQDLGWKRAGTMNLNIRYAQMSMALIAQAVLYQLRQRLGLPWATYESRPFAQKFLRGLDGDVRVHRDTILVTLYNAPDAERWRQHFEHLPERLAAENVSPHIPWLYNFKLDFRFK